jgi:ribosome maturation factor RimP
MARKVREVEQGIDARVEALGFEIVERTWAGSARRPLLRLRIDRAGDGPREAVTVGECASVSRALEPWLDELEQLADRYVIEVSSPGVERPLTRRKDWLRFVGENVAIKGHSELAGRARRLEGELLGLVEETGDRPEEVRLRLGDGEEVRIPMSAIAGAHLLFRWK